MKTFLKYVARDILEKYGNNLNDIAVVFPNKRAALFLNESLARLTDHPIWSPSYITISDLFRKHSTLKVGDPIKLVCDLHKTFVACTGIDETLDHFMDGDNFLSQILTILIKTWQKQKNSLPILAIYMNLMTSHILQKNRKR